jgi:hypothetical protein
LFIGFRNSGFEQVEHGPTPIRPAAEKY